jgi:[protein]-arginine 3-hydroxylase / protease
MARLPRPVPDIVGPDALAAHAARGEAGVLRGAASGWPAFDRWTLASLRERLGERPVPSARLRGRRLQVDRRRGIDLRAQPAAEVLAGIERGDHGAYLMAPLDALPAELRAEVVVPAPCRGAAWVSSKLWVSPAGAISPLHFDMAHNLHAQIHGTKRLLVFERGRPWEMYPEPPWSPVPNFSRVDPEAPDLDRFPRFRNAAPLTCTLSPGDVVFLPARAWHHVTSLATSISVNFWWANGALAWLVRAADALKRARGISR